LWRWSVTDLEGFWGALWDFYGLRAATPPERALAERTMPGAEWFPGARLSYAEHLVGGPEDADQIAVVARSQTRDPMELTFGELRDLAGRIRAGLQRLGVRRGDRVVAYMPNIPETLAAFIATASLGAIWATCAPEFGVRSVVDRFAQIAPRVLLTVGGYGYRNGYVDCRGEVEAIRARLPTLQQVVGVPYGPARIADATTWEELTAESAPLEFESVDFAHPLYVLFSSGTTRPPKAIVHGHGGQLIEHHKNQGIGWDLKPVRIKLAHALLIALVGTGANAGVALVFTSSASAQSSSCAGPVTSAPTGPATVSAASTPFGRVLVVGSGPSAGCSLYLLTSDQLHALTGAPFACSDNQNVRGKRATRSCGRRSSPTALRSPDRGSTPGSSGR
jgi:acyl-CoA synthetase (AMP-forming)/AMP-acid ligase II